MIGLTTLPCQVAPVAGDSRRTFVSVAESIVMRTCNHEQSSMQYQVFFCPKRGRKSKNPMLYSVILPHLCSFLALPAAASKIQNQDDRESVESCDG